MTGDPRAGPRRPGGLRRVPPLGRQARRGTAAVGAPVHRCGPRASAARDSGGWATEFVWAYFSMLTLTSLLGLGPRTPRRVPSPSRVTTPRSAPCSGSAWRAFLRSRACAVGAADLRRRHPLAAAPGSRRSCGRSPHSIEPIAFGGPAHPRRLHDRAVHGTGDADRAGVRAVRRRRDGRPRRESPSSPSPPVSSRAGRGCPSGGRAESVPRAVPGRDRRASRGGGAAWLAGVERGRPGLSARRPAHRGPHPRARARAPTYGMLYRVIDGLYGVVGRRRVCGSTPRRSTSRRRRWPTTCGDRSLALVPMRRHRRGVRPGARRATRRQRDRLPRRTRPARSSSSSPPSPSLR